MISSWISASLVDLRERHARVDEQAAHRHAQGMAAEVHWALLIVRDVERWQAAFAEPQPDAGMPGERSDVSEEGSYPQIDVAGTPGEMGRAHGRQLSARIRHTAAAMRARLGSEPYDAGWAAFQDTLTHCRRHAPELVEEMEGIAEGTEVPFQDVFNINAHQDLFVWKRLVCDAARRAEAAACSSHAVATPSDVLLGWNGDDWVGWLDCA